MSRHRQAGRGAALQTAAIATNPHDSMLVVWALLALAALGMCWIVASNRRRAIGWAGGAAASRIASLRPSAGRGLDASTSPEEIAAPTGGWAPSLFALTEAAPVKEITAPEGGWAPPLFAHSEAPVEDITAPAGGWAPALFDRSEAAPIEEITAPEGGWAPPIHGLSAPVSNSAAVPSGARGRAVAKLRELRAHPPTTLGVAGGAVAAILAVATRRPRS